MYYNILSLNCIKVQTTRNFVVYQYSNLIATANYALYGRYLKRYYGRNCCKCLFYVVGIDVSAYFTLEELM